MRTLRTTLLALALATPAACREPADPTVKETPISIVSESVGVGDPVTEGDEVTIGYVVRTEDGRDLLRESGYRFVIGDGAVISGVDEAVRGMRVSGRRRIVCPPHRHWGRAGYGGRIPPNATLSIQIELQAVN